VSQTRWAAAQAWAGREVPPDEAVALARALTPQLWRIAQAGTRQVLTVTEDLQLHGTVLGEIPVVRLTPTTAKTLLAVLLATAATGATHPYPGRITAVDDVVAILGGPHLGPTGEAHIKGALNKLHGWQLVALGVDEDEGVSADLGVPVRVGPAVALWSGPWVGELLTLLTQVAEQRGLR
jgi:hypothetical protein